MSIWGAPGGFAWMKALFAAAVLAVGAQTPAAQAETAVQILAADPASPAQFGQWADFALRIGYNSGQPIIISAEPLYEDRPVPAINGGEAHIDAGQGEILLWFAYDRPQRIDAVAVIARSAAGKFLTQTNLPVELAWTGRPTAPAPRADWVERLKQEGQIRAKARIEATYNSPGMRAMNTVAEATILIVPGYFVLQTVLVWRLRGTWRKAAAAPLLPMGAVLVYTIYAVLDGSNIAPVAAILTAPFAFIYLAVVAGLSWMGNRPAVGA